MIKEGFIKIILRLDCQKIFRKNLTTLSKFEILLDI